MTANIDPIYPGTITTDPVRIQNADGTTEKVMLTAGAAGARIDVITATSTDTTDRTLALYIQKNGTSYRLGETTIPDGSGTNGADKTVDVLAAALPWLTGSLHIEAGCSLTVALTVAATSGKVVDVAAFGGDY